jgi:hypothetical protein
MAEWLGTRREPSSPKLVGSTTLHRVSACGPKRTWPPALSMSACRRERRHNAMAVLALGRCHIRRYMGSSMKFAEPRPYADPEKAARRIMEIASTIEPAQDGRIHK